MSNVISAGGIVTKIENNQTKICLVSLDPLNDKYVFPKGHQEKQETYEETALREVKEEIGLKNLTIKKYLGIVTRKATERDGTIVDKDIYLFLMETDNYQHNKSEETYSWFSLDEAIKILLPEEKEFLLIHKSEIF